MCHIDIYDSYVQILTNKLKKRLVLRILARKRQEP